MIHDNHVISLTEFSSNTNPKCPVIAPFLNFSRLRRSEDGKQLSPFQSETSVLKFFRHSTNQAKVNVYQTILICNSYIMKAISDLHGFPGSG